MHDGDILEWYFQDGTIDQLHAHHRDCYGASAASHLCSIIEGLFGPYPSGIGFEILNVYPNFPLLWRNTEVWIRITLPLKGYFQYIWYFDSLENTIKVTTTSVSGTLGHFRLRVPHTNIKRVLWNRSPLDFSVYQLHTDYFIEFTHPLDGGKIIVEPSKTTNLK